jgi:hypothetical protein
LKSLSKNLLIKKTLNALRHYIFDIFLINYLGSLISLISLIFVPRLFAKTVRLAFLVFSFSQKNDIPLPIGDERIKETPSVFDDFLVQISGIKKIDEINIVMHGKSLEKYEKSIDYSLPTFYVNFYGHHRSKIQQNNSNIINITGDSRVYKIMKGETNKPIIFISMDKSKSSIQPYKGSSKIYSKDALICFVSPLITLEGMQFGSGLGTIVALKKISNKINIYGWDNYLDKDIRELSLIQYISYLHSIPKSPYYRRLYLMTEKVVNLVYAYRIASNDKIKIYSYLTGISDSKDLYFKYRSFIYK